MIPPRGSARHRTEPAARDQHESAFAGILAGLVKRVPGARGVALVDHIGETVDYAGRLTPFDVRLSAAHWRIVLDEVGAQSSFRDVRSIFIRASRISYAVHLLPEGYALVLVLTRAASFFRWRRAVAACARALGEEAGWTQGAGEPPPWFAVDVVFDGRKRPTSVRVDGALHPLEILGRLTQGLLGRERGWRVRFDTGVEAMLVREPGGACYADEPFAPPRTGSEQPGKARPQKHRQETR